MTVKVIALALLVGLCLNLHAAPVPFAKPKAPPPPTLPEKLTEGFYELHWGGDVYHMTLGKNGAYKTISDDGHTIWLGSHNFDKDGKFYITETTDLASPSWDVYEVTLDPVTLKGNVTGPKSNGLVVSAVKVNVERLPAPVDDDD